MSKEKHCEKIKGWIETVRSRYESYLKTLFYFKDQNLRKSFLKALQGEGELLKGPFPEDAEGFITGEKPRKLADEYFGDESSGLAPALINHELYKHQERAIRATYKEQQNIVVATGTASGKTESFLYPILFSLYRQYLDGKLEERGVRALILYPMNALANDQRERLGEICEGLKKAENCSFVPTFGQYIGQTPEDKNDTYRNKPEQLPGELIFRKEMRKNPPHILLTNYSMLEYLLIRPDDSPLFDNGLSRYWQFIVLDEAHQYRGAKGMEMGMLIRRLKQRLRDGGRDESDAFRCIATSATLAAGQGEKDEGAVAEFAKELFGEKFSRSGIIFGEHKPHSEKDGSARRYHAFVRALEGAFLVHEDGEDSVVLNRKEIEGKDGLENARPLEIALCKECGQHYYVGRYEKDNGCREGYGRLVEAVRDPSHKDFRVDYYLPIGTDRDAKGATYSLCRRCGILSTINIKPGCECGATIYVKKCDPHKEHPDQLKKCETCGYRRGGIGDPVQEIVHGSDGPNTVIATAVHELLPQDNRKILAFADNRQEAAFFAWYAQDSYEKLRDRNLMLRALRKNKINSEGLSIDDLKSRLFRQWDSSGIFREAKTEEDKARKILTVILREALTDDKRLSLSGVGLIRWFVKPPNGLKIPRLMRKRPWEFTCTEAYGLLCYLLDEFRLQRAMALDPLEPALFWENVFPQRPQKAYIRGKPGKQKNISEWGGSLSAIVNFLCRLLNDSGLRSDKKLEAAKTLLKEVWEAIRKHDKTLPEADNILLRYNEINGAFILNPQWLRLKLAEPDEILECETCGRISTHNIRKVCPRNRCPGELKPADRKALSENHYRILYESPTLPPNFYTEEHTAQIGTDTARKRQNQFKKGNIHLLSSSTTFELGVDLGDLETVFLRNVPPENFNYTQRVGRTGRQGTTPGLALTYCRRNPHDLYHYEDPENRLIKGKIRPPQLKLKNEKIISRHMVAVALSAFFKSGCNRARFKTVEEFIGDWKNPKAVIDIRKFCEENSNSLKASLYKIVPKEMYEEIGLNSNIWIDKITGPDSRLNLSVKDIIADYQNMKLLRDRQVASNKGTDKIEARRKTIAREKILDFLSRKAIIPKYGFPVDVVELDTRPQSRKWRNANISLQRDLSQAIAEYAPGSKIIANKLEWESCGVKTIPNKRLPSKYYTYNDEYNFQQWDEDENDSMRRKYLCPLFGFVTELFFKPKEPTRRTKRLYTTRPFFQRLDNNFIPNPKKILGVKVTQAIPGTLVILCEGRKKEGFFICHTCGRHMTELTKNKHKTPEKLECHESMERFSLGYELVTDVVRIEFPGLKDQWSAYSLAYAIVLGAAETMAVPETDLNVTLTAVKATGEIAIVLYDNVPGGAGLVSKLQQEGVFEEILGKARDRVKGNCCCNLSCYGCLRSYRNQFAHPHLDRKKAWDFLEGVLLQTSIT